MIEDARIENKAVAEFMKTFSCSYSVTRNLGEMLGVNVDVFLLSSVVGFGVGVSTMGDTCGAVNGGIIVLGKRFATVPSPEFYLLCAEYYRRLERRLGTPDCGRIHGGKHLASNFRRAILTGKTRQCVRMVRGNADILVELAHQVEKGDYTFVSEQDCSTIKKISQYFEQSSFHCCQSVISEVADHFDLGIRHILGPSRGFCGGIGYNGTLCGAIAGGVLCLGLVAGVDLSKSTRRDTLRLVVHGLIKSDGIFRDGKRFMPARLFTQCQEVYRAVEVKYGGSHCHEILGLRLDIESGVQQYMAENKIDGCRAIVKTVSDTVVSLASDTGFCQR